MEINKILKNMYEEPSVFIAKDKFKVVIDGKVVELEYFMGILMSELDKEFLKVFICQFRKDTNIIEKVIPMFIFSGSVAAIISLESYSWSSLREELTKANKYKCQEEEVNEE